MSLWERFVIRYNKENVDQLPFEASKMALNECSCVNWSGHVGKTYNNDKCKAFIHKCVCEDYTNCRSNIHKCYCGNSFAEKCIAHLHKCQCNYINDIYSGIDTVFYHSCRAFKHCYCPLEEFPIMGEMNDINHTYTCDYNYYYYNRDKDTIYFEKTHSSFSNNDCKFRVKLTIEIIKSMQPIRIFKNKLPNLVLIEIFKLLLEPIIYYEIKIFNMLSMYDLNVIINHCCKRPLNDFENTFEIIYNIVDNIKIENFKFYHRGAKTFLKIIDRKSNYNIDNESENYDSLSYSGDDFESKNLSSDNDFDET